MRRAYAARNSSLPPTPNTRRWLIGAAALAVVALLAPATPAAAKRPVFGIVPQDGALPPSADLDLMPGGGVGGLRTMLSWATVERHRGSYNWTEPDELVRETTNRGIQPFLFLYGTPPWAAKLDERDCAGEACAVYPPRTNTTRDAFGEFAAAAAARYGPGGTFWEPPVDVPPSPPVPDPPLPTEPPCKCTEPHPITVWQIWNEQNSPKYFAPKVNVPRYAALLDTAAAGIRLVDPNAEIVLGGMWGPKSARHVVMTNKEYLNRLYGLGAADDFDSIAIHPYADNAKLSVDQLETARRLVYRHGDSDAAMWVTEVGWAARGPADNPYVKGLNGQARVLVRALSAYERLRRTLKLRGVFWYSWRDKKGGEAICDWCGYAGLRTKTGEAKPAWEAFTRVARR